MLFAQETTNSTREPEFPQRSKLFYVVSATQQERHLAAVGTETATAHYTYKSTPAFDHYGPLHATNRKDAVAWVKGIVQRSQHQAGAAGVQADGGRTASAAATGNDTSAVQATDQQQPARPLLDAAALDATPVAQQLQDRQEPQPLDRAEAVHDASEAQPADSAVHAGTAAAVDATPDAEPRFVNITCALPVCRFWRILCSVSSELAEPGLNVCDVYDYSMLPHCGRRARQNAVMPVKL